MPDQRRSDPDLLDAFRKQYRTFGPGPAGLRCQWTQRGGYPQCRLLLGHEGTHTYNERVTCPTCHGSGMVDNGLGGQEPCPTCGEDGYVDREVASWFDE